MTLNISRKCLNLAEPAVELNRKDNGEILLKSSDIIGAYPKNLGVWVAKWAEKTPDNIFLAEKIDNDNFWNEITYQDFLKKTKSVGQALIDRKLSIERPVAILSDNSIDNALLLFGAMHVGIPVVPPTGIVKISPFPNPQPGFLNTKSMTLDPCPTTICTTALVPTPTILDDEYCKFISEKLNGS